MKCGRFTEEQMTLAPGSPTKVGRVHHLEKDGREAEPVYGRADHRDIAGAGGGGEDSRCVPQARDQQRDVLLVEGQIWRSRCVGCQAVEVAGRRECQAEEAVGRGDARQRDSQGYRLKKNGDARRQTRGRCSPSGRV